MRAPAKASAPRPPAPAEPPRAKQTAEEERIYMLRLRVMYKLCRLDDKSLAKLVEVLDALSDRDAAKVAAYAAALADWPDPDASST